MPAEPWARFDGVGLEADGRTILSGITLALGARSTAVIGANGSGKSTFVRMLNALRVAGEGSVRVLGLDPVRDAKELRRRVGFVFTNPEAQILMPTPAEDVALSLRGAPRADLPVKVAEVLAAYGLEGHRDTAASALSGGQRQLLAIASVLATEPELVVADEPTTLLDLRNSRRVGDLLLSLDAPVVLVTHDLELAARCEEAVLFEGGAVSAVGDPGDVIAAYRGACP